MLRWAVIDNAHTLLRLEPSRECLAEECVLVATGFLTSLSSLGMMQAPRALVWPAPSGAYTLAADFVRVSERRGGRGMFTQLRLDHSCCGAPQQALLAWAFAGPPHPLPASAVGVQRGSLAPLLFTAAGGAAALPCCRGPAQLADL